MNAERNRSFASVLEDLLVETAAPGDGSARPTLAFDYLTIAEELYSGSIRVSEDAMVAEYAGSGSFEPGFAAVVPEQVMAALPSIDPDEIAAELSLESTPAEELGQVRRRFAFANHPDRVAPHLRERAIRRMQVANMLIDAAADRHKA